MIANHYAAKLSDLDMQIINYVPQGGNWKNIPESVPSQRLVQIRESYKEGKGSRSTYYGRLRSDMPSYTINTYFTSIIVICHNAHKSKFLKSIDKSLYIAVGTVSSKEYSSILLCSKLYTIVRFFIGSTIQYSLTPDA